MATKQFRMIATLIETVDHIFDGHNFKGEVIMENYGGDLKLRVKIENHLDEELFNKEIVRGRSKYATWVRQILEFEREVHRFGIELWREKDSEGWEDEEDRF